MRVMASTATSLCASAASPASGKRTNVYWLSELVCTGCGAPNAVSALTTVSSLVMPADTVGSDCAPGTTTSAVDCCPACGNFATITSNASRVGTPSGIVLIPDRPVLIPRPLSFGCDCVQYDRDRATMNREARMGHRHGCAITPRVMVSQKPPARPCSSVRPRPNTTPGLVSLSLNNAISAGSNVMDRATDNSTTRIGPPHSPRKSG